MVFFSNNNNERISSFARRPLRLVIVYVDSLYFRLAVKNDGQFLWALSAAIRDDRARHDHISFFLYFLRYAADKL